MNKYFEFAKDFLLSQEVNKIYEQIEVAHIKEDGVDLITTADTAVERLFRETVPFEGHCVSGEEFGTEIGEFTWYIDPIDGTKALATGVPLWGTTISLEHNGECKVALIYNPSAKQLHHAIAGEGAFINGKQITYKPKAATNTQLAFDYVTLQSGSKKDKQIKQTIPTLLDKFYRVRMIGSGSYSLAWLASGLFGAFSSPVRKVEKYVDIAAGLLIAKEAGAEVLVKSLNENEQYIAVGSLEHIEILSTIYKFLLK